MSLNKEQFSFGNASPMSEQHLACVEFSLDNDAWFYADGPKRQRVATRAAALLQLNPSLVTCRQFSPEGEPHALFGACLSTPHSIDSKRTATSRAVGTLLEALDSAGIGAEHATLYTAWDRELNDAEQPFVPENLPHLLPFFHRMDELVRDLEEERRVFNGDISVADFEL